MRSIVLSLAALVVAIACVLCLFLFFWNKTSDTQNDSPLIRQTSNGLVEGIEKTTSLGQKYYAFYGIPYAAPPITGIDQYTGEKVDRRFKAPEPLKANWTGTLKNDDLNVLCLTTEILPASYQHKNYSEDCLFINIFVPAEGAKKKTVLVYIHGAGFDGGVTTDILLLPDFFLTQDNIVVHVEYRVQMYGFLNLGFGEYTGNMGLKDQQLALKWVYENIENFSGNKDKIMIFGASTGASFVHAHMLNVESRKYFTRAFMSSGCVSAYHLREDTHVPTLLECLQINKTGNELVEHLKAAHSLELSNCNYLPWIIFMESPNAPKPFITQTPDKIYKSDKAPIMDTMFSIANQEAVEFNAEMLDWTEPSLVESWNESNRSLPYDEYANFINPGKLREATEKLRKAYFPDTTSIGANKQGNLDYHSDLVVRDNVLKTLLYQTDVNNKSKDKKQHKNTFLIRLSTHSDLDTMETKRKKKYTGAAHSDDLCYMFLCQFLDTYGNVTEVHIQNKDEVYDMVIRRVKMITNFARFGDPTLEGGIQFKSCKSSDEIYCHEISNDPKIRITMDIKKELKYDIWREVEDVYQRWIHMYRL